MHKAIVLDLGKVLIPFDFQRGYEALARACRYPAEEVRQRIKATGLVTPFETGLIEPDDFVKRLSNALQLSMDYTDFCRAWSSIFYGQLIPDDMVAALAARYRLLLLSNTNAIHFRMIQENYPVLRHFHGFVLSYEVRAMKPDARIYQAAIDLARCPAEECFFADDIEQNVAGAKAVGMDAVRFESLAQLEREFKSRGITWDGSAAESRTEPQP